MLRLLALLIAATLTVAAILAFRTDPGYALIEYGPWIMESSVAGLAIVALLLFALFHYALRLVGGVRRIPGRWRLGSDRRRETRARRLLLKGLGEIFEGRNGSAEATLLKGAELSDDPTLHHLASALAAHRQSAHERRDRDLHQALDQNTLPEPGIALLWAELRMNAKQWEQALAGLNHLEGRHAKHPHLLALKANLLAHLEEWDELEELLPRLRKLMLTDELSGLEKRLFAARLHEARESGETLIKRWQQLPEALQRDTQLVGDQARRLRALEMNDEAERLIRTTLDLQWDAALARLYGEMEGRDGAAQLAHAERWLKEHERNTALLLALGRLCRRNKLWGKARAHLDAAIAIRPDAHLYLELARVREMMGDPEGSGECYRRGLELATGNGPQVQTKSET